MEAHPDRSPRPGGTPHHARGQRDEAQSSELHSSGRTEDHPGQRDLVLESGSSQEEEDERAEQSTSNAEVDVQESTTQELRFRVQELEKLSEQQEEDIRFFLQAIAKLNLRVERLERNIEVLE